MKSIPKSLVLIIFSIFLISCSSNKYYTVKKGDTLYSISKEKKVSISELKKINNLDDGYLYSGQKIYLQYSNNYKGSYHTVQSGDTLYSISKKSNVKIEELKKINNLKSSTLHVGDKIYLGTNGSHTSTPTKSSDSITVTKFKAPLKTMVVTSPYGYRDHPVLGKKILHTGVDLKASMNTPVYSTSSGIITYAGWMNGYGKIIIINNGNNYETRFAHLNRILVTKGQKINTGEVIGKSGETGRVTGPHLHYEIRHHDKPLNPIK